MLKPARVKLGLVAALCFVLVAAAFYVARPKLIDEGLIRVSLIDNLTEWTGAEVNLRGDARVRYFPRLLVETGEVHVKGITRLPAIKSIEAKRAELRLGLWSLITGHPSVDRITFIEPVIKATSDYRSAAANPAPGKDSTPASAISLAPVDQIYLEKATIVVSGPSTTETFSDVIAKLLLEPSGAHSARGAFKWRKQTVSFVYEGGAPESLANTTRFPIALGVSGTLVSADIEGRVNIGSNIRVVGDMNLGIDSLPRFARWTGVMVPEDQQRGAFSAEGAFHWMGHRIGFDEGSFSLDGNRTLGALSLDFGGARPKIEGTLALQKLDLTPYLARQKAPNKANAPSGTAEPKKPQVDLDLPLLHHVNADLRISTTDLRAGPVAFGSSALALTLNAGKLAADLAVFELCGGSGNSRFEIDATVPETALRVTGSASKISVQDCVGLFASTSPLTGTAEVSADLTSSGRSAEEILDKLRGKTVFAIAAGRVAFDLKNLVGRIRENPVIGWEPVSQASTAFKLFKGDIFWRHNKVYFDSLTMDIGAGELTGTGTAGFAQQNLDMQLVYSEHAATKTADDKEAVPLRQDRIVIKGPWSRPIFSPGFEKSKTRATPNRGNVHSIRQARDMH